MAHEDRPNSPVADWLRTVGIESLCQGDVLVFLYRHQTSLVNAEQIARLLGHDVNPVIAALGRLEDLGLVDRSRINGGSRFYEFVAPADPSRNEPLDRLLALLESRTGRLLVAQQLRRDGSPLAQGANRLLRLEGSGAWLKVI